MKYAIIKVINGAYSIHSEGIAKIEDAKVQYHGVCQTLWNAKDVIKGCVMITDENLEVVDGYREYIRHEATTD